MDIWVGILLLTCVSVVVAVYGSGDDYPRHGGCC